MERPLAWTSMSACLLAACGACPQLWFLKFSVLPLPSSCCELWSPCRHLFAEGAVVLVMPGHVLQTCSLLQPLFLLVSSTSHFKSSFSSQSPQPTSKKAEWLLLHGCILFTLPALASASAPHSKQIQHGALSGPPLFGC